MGRKDKSLVSAFNHLKDKGNETNLVAPMDTENLEIKLEKQNQETEQSNVISNNNTDSISEDVIQNSNTKEKEEMGIVKDHTTMEDIKENLLNMYEEKAKKATVEDTHTRTTFLFRKDLSKRLDKLAKNKRGFKTMFMNKAIEALLDEMEK